MSPSREEVCAQVGCDYCGAPVGESCRKDPAKTWLHPDATHWMRFEGFAAFDRDRRINHDPGDEDRR